MNDAGTGDSRRECRPRHRQQACPHRCPGCDTKRQHHDAGAYKPIGAHRERPVAYAAEWSNRIVGAEGADEREQRDEARQHRPLNRKRPRSQQFTIRERQFLHLTNKSLAFA